MKMRNRILPDWSINSWKSKDVAQSVKYDSITDFAKVCQQLSISPPLIPVGQIQALSARTAAASTSEKVMLLQAGDCAETFDSNADYAVKQANFILLLGSLLQSGLNADVTTIGRIAGQYAKPRSSDVEIKNGFSLPSYRGDMINKAIFDIYSRNPDPRLMLKAYQLSKNNLTAIQSQLEREHGATATNPLFFTSHESLHLPFEAAMTREVTNCYWYNLSAHFLWVGVRTSHSNSAHLEYIRGIMNPIGIKICAGDSSDKISALIDYLNPENIPGRLTLIYRFGYKEIANRLPKLLADISKTGRHVVWMADPMHGNTKLTKPGFKTRYYNEILSELEFAKSTHKKMGILMSGIHLEVTHEDVSECVGGPQQLSESDLQTNYKSLVDPRLNQTQAISLLKEFNSF